MGICASCEFGLETLVSFAILQSADALLPCLDLDQHLRQISVGRRSADHRNIRRALENLFAFLLCHAPQHAKTFALLVELLVVGQPVEDLLLRFITDGTGIVENQPGLFDGLNLPVSFGHKRAHDFFGVVRIHLAPEGFEVKGLLRVASHPGSSITQGGALLRGPMWGGYSCLPPLTLRGRAAA